MEIGGCGERTKTILLVSMPNIATVQAMESQRGQLQPRHHMQHTPDKQPGARSKSRPQGLEVKPLNEGRPPSIVLTASADENGQTTVECQELRKALHELADKGQIDRFLKREARALAAELQDKECSSEIVATITGGYAEGITRSAWKAQVRGAQQVLIAKQGSRITMPTMVFGGE
ncbi:hypothetical protein Cgig2_019737 [Carnegiea gigantea]|uniref:Uncharacterized protein n=1 Tax=Carnegiea gigantea TaxID=171969 RepID=A0A9Q1KN56_9CARY|nr:hypothetical protein Cgig2_019737 [Carnegiea gigantea]